VRERNEDTPRINQHLARKVLTGRRQRLMTERTVDLAPFPAKHTPTRIRAGENPGHVGWRVRRRRRQPRCISSDQSDRVDS
jgi:hypothetical protein